MAETKRLGVNEKWLKVRSKSTDIYSESGKSETVDELLFYVHNGIASVNATSTVSPDIKPPQLGWERGGGVRSDLSIYGFMRSCELEDKAITSGVFDVQLANEAYLAIHTSILIGLHVYHLFPIRFGRSYKYISINQIRVLALGFLTGHDNETLKLMNALNNAYQEGHFMQTKTPVLYLMSKMVADYNQETFEFTYKEKTATPICDAVFEVWRNPNPDALVSACLALCDLHTHGAAPKSKNPCEDFDVYFRRFPIEILLMFKLRLLLGLENPKLDHPLMEGVLGTFPALPATPLEPNNLLKKVFARMVKDGFDEAKILSYYGV